ncbi:MAG: O-antigen ligase [Hydrocarboniphaga sp.]|uniref:O-antigen ligase family protein n=1 Tax=Hydrocarboniphaga sp. TaxID=2033016 RepID=UPI00260E7191|nr:O-antigen ligase family protein [Hydrocarboniphaga sp.]MDB5969097.1 O-antigen ligase [Hydrocarboniphaga sp.]
MNAVSVLPRAAGRPVRAAASAAHRWIDDSRKAPLLTLLVWTLIVLMIVPEGFDYKSLSSNAMPASGGAVSRLLWLGLLGGGLLVLVWRSALAWLLFSRLNLFFLIFLVLATASIAWSIEPAVTTRRMIRLYTVVGVGAAFTLACWHERRYQQLMRPVLTAMLAGSIVFGMLYPTLAIHQSTSYELAGAWRGLTNHKNTLGAISSITAIFWFHAWLAREVRPLTALFCGAIAMTTLLLSRSSTALVTTLFVFGLLLMLLRSPPNLRRWMPLIITLFVAALLTYALAVLRLVPGTDLLLKPIVMITGKDLTFTGRSDIWALLNEHIRFSPLLGSGYGAYWTGPIPGSPSYVMMQKLHFYPGSAHNGYLEIVNDLGALGLLCLGGYLLTHVAQSLALLRIDRNQAALFLALFFQQAVSNLSETHWLSVMNVDFVIVTLASFALARAHLQSDLRRYFGEPQPAPSPTRAS